MGGEESAQSLGGASSPVHLAIHPHLAHTHAHTRLPQLPWLDERLSGVKRGAL